MEGLVYRAKCGELTAIAVCRGNGDDGVPVCLREATGHSSEELLVLAIPYIFILWKDNPFELLENQEILDVAGYVRSSITDILAHFLSRLTFSE